MIRESQSIFRKEALEELQTRQEAVMPPGANVRAFVLLWGLIGLLMGLGVLAAVAEIPIFVPAQAVVVEPEALPPALRRGGEAQAHLVAVVPASYRHRLAVGRRLVVQTGEASWQTMQQAVAAVDTTRYSPALLRHRWRIDWASQPASLVSTAFVPQAPERAPEDYVGSVYPVRLEVGSKTLLSLLPGIGKQL